MSEHEADFMVIAEIYEKLMKELDIEGPVPHEYQEDEAFIGGRFAYDMWRDTTYGTCGKLGACHECDPNHEWLVLGSGIEAFKRIENAALFEQRASYLCAVLVIPLHPRLPALPVVVHETCLRFDTPWIRRSWERIEAFGDMAFAKSLGPVAQGHGSDGAAQLFKAMKQRMMIVAGPGRFDLAAPGLFLTESWLS
jgi:hypothetical protein